MKTFITLFFCGIANLQAMMIVQQSPFAPHLKFSIEGPSNLNQYADSVRRIPATIGSMSIDFFSRSSRAPNLPLAFPVGMIGAMLAWQGAQAASNPNPDHSTTSRQYYFRIAGLIALGFLGMGAAEESVQQRVCSFRVVNDEFELSLQDCQVFDESILISACQFHQKNLLGLNDSASLEKAKNATSLHQNPSEITLNQDETLYTVHALNDTDRVINIEPASKTFSTTPLSLYIVYDSNQDHYYFLSTDHLNNLQIFQY